MDGIIRGTVKAVAIDLALARTCQEAETILWKEWSRECEFPEKGVPDFCNPVELELGFVYLLFTEGRLRMAELLKQGGDRTDPNGPIACEEFYYLLNEIDGGEPTFPSEKPLVERVGELFAPFVVAARSVLPELP